jgi:hypothetical protein
LIRGNLPCQELAFLLDFLMNFLEARVGIEPTHKGFADLSLTSWVPRPNPEYTGSCAGHGVMPLSDLHALMPDQDGDTLNRHAGEQEFHGKGVADLCG